MTFRHICNVVTSPSPLIPNASARFSVSLLLVLYFCGQGTLMGQAQEINKRPNSFCCTFFVTSKVVRFFVGGVFWRKVELQYNLLIDIHWFSLQQNQLFTNILCRKFLCTRSYLSLKFICL